MQPGRDSSVPHPANVGVKELMIVVRNKMVDAIEKGTRRPFRMPHPSFNILTDDYLVNGYKWVISDELPSFGSNGLSHMLKTDLIALYKALELGLVRAEAIVTKPDGTPWLPHAQASASAQHVNVALSDVPSPSAALSLSVGRSPSAPAASRPSLSPQVPADPLKRICDACKRRKGRCVTNVGDSQCLHCRSRSQECTRLRLGKEALRAKATSLSQEAAGASSHAKNSARKNSTVIDNPSSMTLRRPEERKRSAKSDGSLASLGPPSNANRNSNPCSLDLLAQLQQQITMEQAKSDRLISKLEAENASLTATIAMMRESLNSEMTKARQDGVAEGQSRLVDLLAIARKQGREEAVRDVNAGKTYSANGDVMDLLISKSLSRNTPEASRSVASREPETASSSASTSSGPTNSTVPFVEDLLRKHKLDFPSDGSVSANSEEKFSEKFIQSKLYARCDNLFNYAEYEMEKKPIVDWPAFIVIDNTQPFGPHEPGYHGALLLVEGAHGTGQLCQPYATFVKNIGNTFRYIGHYWVFESVAVPYEVWTDWPQGIIEGMGEEADDRNPHTKVSVAVLEFGFFQQKDLDKMVAASHAEETTDQSTIMPDHPWYKNHKRKEIGHQEAEAGNGLAGHKRLKLS